MVFRFLDDVATADVAFEIEAHNLEELFRDAALATTGSMVNVDKVEPKTEKSITIENENIEKLLFAWLEEIVFLKDSEQIVFHGFDITINKDKRYKLDAVLKGEKIDMEKHEPRNDVKAVTMHKFKVEKTDKGWKATVILDI